MIIFVRNPELGKVKTRLAATVGDEKALEIYQSLLTYTQTLTAAVNAEKFVFYFNEIAETDIWSAQGFTKKLQSGGDLGDKMKAAFDMLFQQKNNKVVIIGSDCFELTNAIIDAAFAALNKYDVVIGPATDGGYYLLGMQNYFPFIFDHKKWSTGNVFKETIEDVEKHKISYAILDCLTDVDIEEDWIKTRLH